MDVAGQIGAVAVVLALLGGTLWWLRGRGAVHGAAAKARKLRVVERVQLGPHHALHLVRFSGKAMLVASSPSGCALLQTGEWKDLDFGAEAES